MDATGKIVTMAEAFTAKYGVKATGVKMNGQNQEQVILREAAANNVRTDVFNMSNLPSVTSEIIVQGAGLSWLPVDLKDQVPAEYQNPAITSLNPWVWAYNSDVHGDKCPIDNIWALTTEEWKGRIAIPDPLLRNETMFWFNQIAEHDDEAMRKAYEEFFGEPLKTDEASATAEWVKRFAKNRPSVTRSDTEVGPIIGAKGQEKPFMGFLSTSIFRDAKKNGYTMGICAGMKPGRTADATRCRYRIRYEKPECIEALRALHDDGRGHGSAVGRRKNFVEQGRQDSRKRSVWHRESHRPALCSTF